MVVWCAVAHVVKDVCSSKWTGGTAVSVDRMTGFAKAWARVRPPLSAVPPRWAGQLSGRACLQPTSHSRQTRRGAGSVW